MLIDNGCEHMDAEKVKDKALFINSGHFGLSLLIQYSKNLEKIIIPKVEPADKANETDTIITIDGFPLLFRSSSGDNQKLFG